LIRKADLLRIGGFRVGLPCAQEYDLHLRLAIQLGRRFVPIPHLGARIRPTPGSVSRGAGVKMPYATANVMMNCVRLLQRRGMLDDFYRDIIVERLIRLARRLWRMEAFQKSSEVFFQAKQLSPCWYRHAYRSRLASCIAHYFGFAFYERLHGVTRRLRHIDPT
jgi:hypothetical protein